MSNEPSVTFQGTDLEARKDTVSGTQVVKAASWGCKKLMIKDDEIGTIFEFRGGDRRGLF